MFQASIQRARELRRNLTEAERLLWNRLRNQQLGVKFRRQAPIGPYIVDFLCPQAHLIIEIDGGQHNASPGDLQRDGALRAQGYAVLRFWNNEVLANTEGVLLTIVDALRERVQGYAFPPPNLPHARQRMCPLPTGGEGWGGEQRETDPLAPLRAQLSRIHPACAVRWVERTGSTNADLLAAARTGQLDSPTLLATRQQTAGRGRQGRVWLDDAQTSVLCSVAWPFAPQHDIRALSLAVGVWLAQALHALGAGSVRLKWPNDLLLPVQGNWRKLGGVLVEMADTAAARWVVIGFGLNLRSPTGQPQAAGLDAAGLTLDRGAVLAALAPALLNGLQGGLRQRDAALAQWDALHAWAGLDVSVQDRGLTLYCGTALGLAPDGALRVRTADGERRVLSADVSLRLAAALAAGAAK